MHAGSTQLDHLAAKRFVRREIEFLLAVITEIRCRQLTGLQAIRADNFASRDFLNDQMIAEFVKWIDIQARRVRFGQPFAKLEIENLKPQPLGATHFLRVLRQSHGVTWPLRLRFLYGSVCFGQNH
jgi:hypothetical protein